MRQATRIASSNLVLASVIVATAFVVAKLIGAAITGSAGVLAEAIHSIAAATSQAFLLVGWKRAARSSVPDGSTGRARELSFWALVVPILLYSLGAGVAINEGVRQIQYPRPAGDASVGLIILGVAFLVQTVLTYSSVRTADATTDGSEGVDEALALESQAALTGLVVAILGVAGSLGLDWPGTDAWASVFVGLIMGCVAAKMALRTRALLCGAALEPRNLASQRDLVEVPEAIDAEPPASLMVGASMAIPEPAEAGKTAGSATRASGNVLRKSYPPTKAGKGRKKRR